MLGFGRHRQPATGSRPLSCQHTSIPSTPVPRPPPAQHCPRLQGSCLSWPLGSHRFTNIGPLPTRPLELVVPCYLLLHLLLFAAAWLTGCTVFILPIGGNTYLHGGSILLLCCRCFLSPVGSCFPSDWHAFVAKCATLDLGLACCACCARWCSAGQASPCWWFSSLPACDAPHHPTDSPSHSVAHAADTWTSPGAVLPTQTAY